MKLSTTLFVFLLTPVTVLAATLNADDSVAGMGTDIDMAGLKANSAYIITVTPPLGNETRMNFSTNNEGNAHVSIAGKETEIAGFYSVQIEKDGVIDSSTTFEVLTDTVHSAGSSITTSKETLRTDGKDTARIQIILRDRYGNPIVNRPVQLISNRSSDIIYAVSTETDKSGLQEFTVQARDAGTIVLRVMDLVRGEMLNTEITIQAGNASMGGNENLYTNLNTSSNTRQFFGPGQNVGNYSVSYGSNLRAQVQYGTVDHFIITAPRELRVNEDATIRITAVDEAGNRVEDYTGTVLLSSTDPSAFLPVSGEIPFRAQDFGEKQLTLGLRFRTPDEHILHAQDSANEYVYGEAVINVLGSSTNHSGTKIIQIENPKENDLLNNSNVIIKGTAEPFVNLFVTGGMDRVTGDTDINGNFSISIDLDTSKTTHTLRVQDDSGYLDSGDIQVKLDTELPKISSVSFIPENPEEGTDVLMIVVSEDTDIKEISAKLIDESITLDNVSGQVGKYQALFAAPAAGTHNVTVTINDIAENINTKDVTLISVLKGLPKVQGVTAETEDNAVTLQWDAVTNEPIEAYRIYVGENPTEFSFSLDTNYATTAAQVAGLQPGTEYFFAVTALQGERESSEKSDVVKASVNGLRLEVTGRKNSLLLDWSNMSTLTPLSSFILEYGVEPGIYTEKRILSGDARNYILHDLLNGVTYFLKISPVSVTGTIIEEMIAEGEGVPTSTSTGFEPSNADPVPYAIGNNNQGNLTPPPNLHQGAPTTNSSGLPSFMWWVICFVSTVLFAIWWKRRKNVEATLAFLRTMDNRYRQ